MSEACLKQRYGFTTLYRERGGILYALFQIPIIFCHWLLEIKKKKKEEVHCMLIQIIQICFKESDYATLDSVMRIMKENSAKWWKNFRNNGFKLFLSGTCQKVLLQVHRDRRGSLVKLLWIYFCYFDVLHHD